MIRLLLNMCGHVCVDQHASDRVSDGHYAATGSIKD